MLVHAQAAVRYLADADAALLEADGEKRSAVLWTVSIVGEAAARLSDEARATLTDLPLREAQRMRNMLIHGYLEIDLALVAQTVARDFPPLIAHLERLLEGEPPE
ncbi:MAG: DUF86 domain-containing protein [Caulobacteraceae bacterium]|nr:DUF86 domain-containing protein [Caulobacter sp.]